MMRAAIKKTWKICTDISADVTPNFRFFSLYLLQIGQAQLKYSNYDVLLSTWLVSMVSCPKGIFISIWHLPAQIKVHKENIRRTKRETSETYSEPCQISKMRLFCENT